jgi:hypothetical protein
LGVLHGSPSFALHLGQTVVCIAAVLDQGEILLIVFLIDEV